MPTEKTIQHKFNLPDKGASDWNVLLNENFEALDHKTPIVDIKENRPTAGVEDRVFIATDTEEIFIDTGTGWNLINSGSGSGGSITFSEDGTTITSSLTSINVTSDLAASGDGSGNVTLSADPIAVTDSGSAVSSRLNSVDIGNNLSATTDGNGNVTVDGASGSSTGPTYDRYIEVSVTDQFGITPATLTSWDTDPSYSTIANQKDVAAELQTYIDNLSGEKNVVFVFEDGQYRWDSTLEVLDWERISFVARDHARFVQTAEHSTFFNFDGKNSGAGEELYMENVTFDVSKSGMGARLGWVKVHRHLGMKDVRYRGQRDLMSNVANNDVTFQLTILDEDGFGYVDGLYAPDGTYQDTSAATDSHPSFLNTSPDHYGSLWLNKAYIEGFVSGGIYVARAEDDANGNLAEGHWSVTNATVKDCMWHGIRIGHSDIVRGCKIIETGVADATGFQYTGFRVQRCQHTLVENIEIEAQSNTADCFRVRDADAVTIKDVDITYNGEGNDCVMVYDSLYGSNGTEGPVTFENLTIEDTAAGGGGIGSSVQCDRGNVTFDNCRFDVSQSVASGETASGRSCIELNNADEVTIENCTFDNTNPDQANAIYFNSTGGNVLVQNNDFINGDVRQASSTTMANVTFVANTIGDSQLALSGTQQRWDARLNADSSGTHTLKFFDRTRFTPNDGLPVTDMADGESADVLVPVPNGHTINVWGWGARTRGDTTPTGLTVELVNASGTSVNSANTGWSDGYGTAPVAADTNSSGSMTHYLLRVANNTGTDHTGSGDGVGAQFAYTVDR